MGRQFAAFPAEVETLIRGEVSKIAGFGDVESPVRWKLRGASLSFYRNAWLAYIEAPGGAQGQAQRLYFVAQMHKRGRKKFRIVPVANQAGSVDRANRECELRFSGPREKVEVRVVDYLNFYYAFTPQDDPILANLKEGPEGPTQFSVPTTVGDLQFGSDGGFGSRIVVGEPGATCSEECLARGAVWHFLEEEQHEGFVPIRLKTRVVPYLRYTGRVAIQFQDALFASDFRLPASTGIPVLSNPELLYQSGALRSPVAYPDTTLPLPAYLSTKELWRTLKEEIWNFVFGLGSVAATFIAWCITLLFAGLWLLSALFPIAEMAGWSGMRTIVHHLGGTLGLAAWPETLFGLSLIAIGAFLVSIFYTTHMDKIFNWVFRLCPRGWREWVAGKLDERVGKRDRGFIAQDTFRKRAWWVLIRLTYWTSYVVLAFASLQIASNVMFNRQSATAATIVWTLVEQAALNIPLIVYVLLRLQVLADRADPVSEGILGEHLLFWFHLAIVVVVLKGIYRVWVFTVEASPHAFYRRLPTTRRRLDSRMKANQSA